MIWRATLNNGIMDEVESDLSKVNIKDLLKLELTGTRDDLMAHFSADTGVVRFPNIDERILNNTMPHDITLRYDHVLKTYVMDEKSLEFYQSVMFKEDILYDKIGFNKLGVCFANGEVVIFEFIDETGKQYPLYGFEITKLTQWKESDSNIISDKEETVSSLYTLKSRNIGYHMRCIYDDGIEILTNLTLTYDVYSRSIFCSLDLNCNRDLNGVFKTTVGQNISSGQFSVVAGQTVKYKGYVGKI